MAFRFKNALISSLACSLILFSAIIAVPGQPDAVNSQEVSESDGLPVIVKHLPEQGRVPGSAAFLGDAGTLRATVGDRPVTQLIELGGGTEAATAVYPEGRLLIVEYTTPQAAAAADEAFRQSIQQAERPIAYRRVGNYSVFVFDPADEQAAGALIDQVKYEKRVQWLGEDPFLVQKLERAFVYTTRDIFTSTVLVIIFGIGGSIVAGLGVGYAYFLVREHQRARRTRFSDAGGLTRLNLDDLSEPFSYE